MSKPTTRLPRAIGLTVAATPLCLLMVLASGAAQAVAQEHEVAEHEEVRPRHRLAIFTGNTWIPQGDHEGAIHGLIAAPTVGIDYAYRLGERFAISSINDLQIDSYVIEREDGSELERERLFVTSLVLMWEAVPRLQLFIGPGLEADKHETLGLVKIGVEWELFEPHPWDVALNAAWDIKEEYDAIAVGLSIGRLWP
jgi:hypothetical protein